MSWKVGDVLVYDRGIGGSTSYMFLKITSFTKSGNPRVVYLKATGKIEYFNIGDTSEGNVVPIDEPINLIEKPLRKREDGYYIFEHRVPCLVELYDNTKTYRQIRYHN